MLITENFRRIDILITEIEEKRVLATSAGSESVKELDTF